mmetsp:Transcript_4308/g.9828  ORF Transcript_4308/g.9828 Transcript_4308/m.9828 type:complete len:371 (+) Transcript_4308:1783-2895(+)
MLEHRLSEVDNIVHNDFTADLVQLSDVCSEARLTVEGSREGKLGAGGYVVNDLHHPPTLITAHSLILDDLHSFLRQVVLLYQLVGNAGGVVGVREHAHLHARAVHGILVPDLRRVRGVVALGRHSTHQLAHGRHRQGRGFQAQTLGPLLLCGHPPPEHTRPRVHSGSPHQQHLGHLGHLQDGLVGQKAAPQVLVALQVAEAEGSEVGLQRLGGRVGVLRVEDDVDEDLLLGHAGPRALSKLLEALLGHEEVAEGLEGLEDAPVALCGVLALLALLEAVIEQMHLVEEGVQPLRGAPQVQRHRHSVHGLEHRPCTILFALGLMVAGALLAGARLLPLALLAVRSEGVGAGEADTKGEEHRSQRPCSHLASR